MVVMKRTIVLALTSLLLLFSGCKKEEPKDLTSQLIGDWELVGYDAPTKSITIGEEEVVVYISFFLLENYEFSLRQELGQGYLKTFAGTWSLIGNTLSGEYDDGTAWGNTYTIEIIEDNTLIMTTDSEEKYTYSRVQ